MPTAEAVVHLGDDSTLPEIFPLYLYPQGRKGGR